jgi:transposase
MDRKAIAAVVQKISSSALSVAEYIRRHKIPFSRAQYFRYKAQLEEHGIEGLEDRRSRGNRRTLTDQAKFFLKGAHEANPELTLQELSDRLEQSLKLRIDPTTISRYLRAEGMQIKRPPRPAAVERIDSACGGIEILGAIAMHLGWPDHAAQMIVQERERFSRTAAFRNERVQRDLKGRQDGHFTADYNDRPDVRRSRFASIEDKRTNKNYSRMKIFEVSPFVIARKCLAILALPLITLNGTTRSANNPLGNALEHFCGFNYQHETLDKVLRELKYLGISGRLLRGQIPFWQSRWPELNENLPLICYYIDGNTKALWSSKRVKQNKVTMNGRVMGCLEQVYIHDGYGHPMFLETYAGKAPVGEHCLEMMLALKDSLEGPGPDLEITRAIILDAASNGVSTLRAFASQDTFHYITSLDDNQWNPRRLIEVGRAQRYRYGKATLRECRFEMMDSKEKGYLVEVRAIEIEWDHGKRTVLITSIPVDVVGASAVVKAYFDRWPYQELQFRGMKHFASLSHVNGYGKKEIPDEKMREKQAKLRKNIAALKRSLKSPLQRIADEEATIAAAIKSERLIKARGKVVDGRRVLPQAQQVKLKALNAQIMASNKQIKAIEVEAGKPLRRLRKYEQEWFRILNKGRVYRVDVELDQLMGFFRIALTNIAAWFLSNCLKSKMSLNRLFSDLLMLPAQIELTDEIRRVILRRNPKDPALMEQLDSALTLLTNLGIKDLEGRKIELQLSSIS